MSTSIAVILGFPPDWNQFPHCGGQAEDLAHDVDEASTIVLDQDYIE